MSNASTAAEPWPDFIGSLTHELRDEASAVLHQVELLRSNGLDELTQRRSLAAIAANADNLMSFIEDLSELGRIMRGEVSTSCRQIELDELIGGSVHDRARLLDWHTPPGAADAWSTFTDPLIVDQIVTGVLDRYYRNEVDANAVLCAHAHRSNEHYIDVVFDSDQSGLSEPAPFRTVTLDDGLSMFVAHKSAELVGGELGLIGTSRRGSYLLRLPQAETRAVASALPD